MPILLDLLLCFAKIGFFTFGGGYAMISIIEDICVNRKKWITHDEMMDITVIAESTPGPIAVNCATFVGYKQAGAAGAAFATLGVIFPSFLTIYLISVFLENFLAITWIAKAFAGIRIAVGVLILNAAFNMIKQMKKKAMTIGILICAALAMLCINFFSLKISSILLMVIAGVFSFICCSVKKQPDGKGSRKK